CGNILAWSSTGSAEAMKQDQAQGTTDDKEGKEKTEAGDEKSKDDASCSEDADAESKEQAANNDSTKARKHDKENIEQPAHLLRGGKERGKNEKQPDWLQLDDDVEALLWAMLNYGEAADRETFCVQNWINPKQIEEAWNLTNQLTQMLTTKLTLPKALLKAGFGANCERPGARRNR
ncbi:unnamed protein product, partial [Amoebophrya sp. A25]